MDLKYDTHRSWIVQPWAVWDSSGRGAACFIIKWLLDNYIAIIRP